jgi:hypothetical protein
MRRPSPGTGIPIEGLTTEEGKDFPMDTQNPSAPSCAQAPVSDAIHATETATVTTTPARPGVVHVNTRHTTRFTVIGNHLAQHPELSLTAIGLATHIQSLPAESRVDIKTLADGFPEGETRIAAALRELEAHGYLSRTRERLPSGRIVTHTVSYNQPCTPDTAQPAEPAPPTNRRDAPGDVPPPKNLGPEPAPAAPPTEAPPTAPKPPLPEPRTPDLDRHRTATVLLASLHRDDPRLLLPERDVRRLAPAVAAWLERGAAPDSVRRTLTACLPPEPLRHPAALLAHRLTELLPPPLPAAPRRPDPFQTCEDCDRAFRAQEPGHCRDCRSDQKEAA